MNHYSDAMDDILLARVTRAEAAVLSLDAYRHWLRDSAPPTDRQIEDFADYVAGARSWYKHLPIIPPGGDFHFYVDRHAGMDNLIHASGEVTVRNRTHDMEPFHYSWMTTADYRERFGCLAFSCASGSKLFSEEQLGDETVLIDNNCLHAMLQISGGTARNLPMAVLAAGTCNLTALIHPNATADLVAKRLAMKKRKPSENCSGARETWSAIMKFWCENRDQEPVADEGIHPVSVNPAFIALMAQEKTRLRQNMIEAMQRMRHITFAD